MQLSTLSLTKNNYNMSRKVLSGKVVSIIDPRTAKVSVSARVFHPVIKKRYLTSKEYLIETNNEALELGSKVSFIESRPLSKRKCWVLLTEAESAAQK